MASGAEILVIEDDPFMVDLLVRKLTSSGFSVTHVTSGEEGIKKLEAGMRPQAISLDIMLPGIDGYETLRRIKANSELAKIPVIIFSNVGNDEDIEKAKSLGALDYLVKISASLDDVAARLKSACTG